MSGLSSLQIISEVFPFVIAADAGIQVLTLPPHRSLDACMLGMTALLRLKARVSIMPKETLKR